MVILEYCGAANRVAVYSGKGPVDVPETTAQPTSPVTTAPSPGQTGAVVPKWGQVSIFFIVYSNILLMNVPVRWSERTNLHLTCGLPDTDSIVVDWWNCL